MPDHASGIYTELVAGNGEASVHISGNNFSHFQHTWATYRRFVCQMKSTSISLSSTGKNTTSLGHDYDLLANLYLNVSLPALSIAAGGTNPYRVRSFNTGAFSENFTNGATPASHATYTFNIRGDGTAFAAANNPSISIPTPDGTIVLQAAVAAAAPAQLLITFVVDNVQATTASNILAAVNAHNAAFPNTGFTAGRTGAAVTLTSAHYGTATHTTIVESSQTTTAWAEDAGGNQGINGRTFGTDGSSGVDGVSWIEYVGYKCIRNVSLIVESQIVQKLSGDFLLLHAELTGGGTGLKRCQDLEMCGKTGGLAPDQSCTLFVPIAFWWTREYSSSFPMVALQFNDTKLMLEMESLDNLIVSTSGAATVTVGGNATPTWNDSGIRLNWMQEAVYLSDEERDIVAGTKLSIDCNTQFATDVLHVNRLVEQCQEYTTTLSPQNTVHKIELPFNFLTKYLIFVLYDTANDTSGDFQTFAQLDRVQLDLNTNRRWGDVSSTDYNKTLWSHVVPYQSFDCIPRIANVYALSHALHAPASQPSGAINMSRIQKVHLRLQFAPGNAPAVTTQLRVYCVSHNVLAFENGTAGVVFNS